MQQEFSIYKRRENHTLSHKLATVTHRRERAEHTVLFQADFANELHLYYSTRKIISFGEWSFYMCNAKAEKAQDSHEFRHITPKSLLYDIKKMFDDNKEEEDIAADMPGVSVVISTGHYFAYISSLSSPGTLRGNNYDHLHVTGLKI